MSLIIKGINMPKNGEMTIAFASDENGENTLALILDTNGNPIEHKGVTEIPTPHGRLIDADELKKNMRNYYPSIDHLCCSQHVVTKRDIDCAPTIIEAEHESEAQKWARVGRDISKGLQEGIEAINSEVPE